MVTLEQWIAERLKIEQVPSFVTEKLEPWRTRIESGDRIEEMLKEEAFVVAGHEAVQLLGIGPQHWRQRTGFEGKALAISPEWLIFLGLTPRTAGAEIPIGPGFVPMRLVIGHNGGQWFAGIWTQTEKFVLMPLGCRGDLFDLCKGLKVELPASTVVNPVPSGILLPH